tara:strand:- start:33481 stop:37053 length:3573 start_codon:yes stop_codon:yes gene_type:complete
MEPEKPPVKKKAVKTKKKVKLIKLDKSKKSLEDADEIQLAVDSQLNIKIKKNEDEERDMFDEDEDEELYSNLYPNLNDPNFSVKIAQKKEFSETKYKGDIANVEIMAEKMCNEDRELAPHQIFVRNFLSFNTPYNSLLLYHGLGSGKTCAAVGIMEETRHYFKQFGIKKPIFVLASPNVQGNFKTEIFDPRKLLNDTGVWKLKSCVGNKLLKEINANSLKMKKENIVKQINRVIKNSYKFLGYEEFASYIIKKSNIEGVFKKDTKQKLVKKKLNNLLENTLIVIDEVHNIRTSGDLKTKRIYDTLMNLAKNVNNLRFVFLSATPMFNNSTEIIPLVNLMNLNDNRSLININEVFDKNGNLKLNDSTGETTGEQLLVNKINGYVSYVRGENPYTYPYRIYPNIYNPAKSILNITYPNQTLNGKEIIQPIQHVDLYTLNASTYQEKVYNYIISLIKTDTITFDSLESFGYTLLTPLVQSLNIVYPNIKFDSDEKVKKELLYGTEGLKSIMTYSESKKDFEYKPAVLEKYGRIFSEGEIEKYSPKINSIIDSIKESTGIILIYSNYLEAGLIPLALALEEQGIKRYGETPSLLKSSTSSSHFKYIIISGDKKLSPNNNRELNACTNSSNKNGDDIKVVLISRAGTEGLDFKNIRQTHILEPWYNMNRIQQTIGRAVRTKSHCQLPFIERNVMIFLYGTILSNDTESTDLYIYRRAEEKAIQIGKVSRLLKQNAVDCLLNKEQGNFTEEKLDQTYDLLLSSQNTVPYKIGDKPFSDICDYMESCNFVCKKEKEIQESDILNTTYNENFSKYNNDILIQKIKQLFKEFYFLKKEDLISHLNVRNKSSLMQIYSALDQMVNDNNEFIYDRYNKPGHLINIGSYYLFQPSELSNNNISLFERGNPIPPKRNKIVLDISPKPDKNIQEKKPIKTPKDDGDGEEEKRDDSSDILKKLKDDYDACFIIKEQKDIRSKHTWNEVCGFNVRLLESIGIDREIIEKYIMNHHVDMLTYDNKVKLLNILYNLDTLDSFNRDIKAYLEEHMMFHENTPAVILLNNKTTKMTQIFLIFKNKEWKETIPEYQKNYASKVKEIKEAHTNNLSKVYGYITPFRKQDIMVFKFADNTKTKEKGRRCDQAKKNDLIGILEKLIKEITKKDITIPTHQNQICNLQELVLRHLNKINHKKQIWFVNPERVSFL